MTHSSNSAPDYRSLIDAQTWQFIEDTAVHYTGSSADQPIAEQRARYDAASEAFRRPHPSGVVAHDHRISTTGTDELIPVRHYHLANGPADAVVLYAHGGGFILGGLESHDDICAEICARTGFDVYAVDYRLAPEHLHPAQYDDCLAAFHWLRAKTSAPIVLVGDSAGGSLCASLSHNLRQSDNPPAGQLLIYAGLGSDMNTWSHKQHANAPMLTATESRYYRDCRIGNSDPTIDTRLRPLVETDYTSLPPTVLITAACDPLSAESELYAEHLAAAGVPVHWKNEEGLVHGYLRGRYAGARMQKSFSRIIAVISALATQNWRAVEKTLA